jgi:hypothetical protein
MELILVFLILVLVFPTWILYANEVTFFQRQKIISGIKHQFDCDKDFSGFVKRMNEFVRVKYDSHLFLVATFRDPMKLYNFGDKDGL